MNFRFVNFICENCNDERTVNLGSYPDTEITSNPCIKCNTKSVIVNTAKEVAKPITESSQGVTIIRNSDRLHSQGLKKTPKEFKQLLKVMKNAHPNSTIVDRS